MEQPNKSDIINSGEKEKPVNQQEKLINVITANAQVNTLINLLQQINFNVVYGMLVSTPAELQQEKNFQVLQATFSYFASIEKIFSEEEKEESVIIKPSFN